MKLAITSVLSNESETLNELREVEGFALVVLHGAMLL